MYQVIISASTVPTLLVTDCVDKLEGTSFLFCPMLLCRAVMHGKTFFQPRLGVAALQDG